MNYAFLTASAIALMFTVATARAGDPAPEPAPIRIAQAGSCQNYFAQCSARCANNAKGESQAKCTADHCRPKLATCRKSGCWTEGAAYGGGTQCGLVKQ